MTGYMGVRAIALHVQMVAVRMVVASACAVLPLLAGGTEAAAQACSARGQACYNWHQCWINRCAGYHVNCNAYATACGTTCYNYWRSYLSSQYGPLPKYCARGR